MGVVETSRTAESISGSNYGKDLRACVRVRVRGWNES
jgi:hypothetical protein